MKIYNTSLLGDHTLSGSLQITGSLNVNGGITGSLFGTASWAVSASWAPAATTAATASFVTASNVYGPNGSNSILSASFAVSSSYAVSASNALTAGSVTSISANIVDNTNNYILTATGGSTIQGESALTFNGSLLTATGNGENIRINSSDTNGSYMAWSNNTTAKGYIGSAYHLFVGPDNIADNFGIRANNSLAISTGGSGVKMFVSSSGNVGIGTTTPNATLDVNGNAIITGSLTVTGRITAEEFHTEFVSASIVYQSGSTKFGDTSDDVMSVTGSIKVQGSITGSLQGTASYATQALSSSYAISSSNALTASFVVSSSYAISSSNALTASFVVSSSYAISSSNAATASWATNVTNNGVTSVSASGTVSGITLGGGPITSTGTLTLSGTVSGLTNSNLSGTAGITNANLATPSLMIGTTNIALGATGSTLAGLTSVAATTFTGALTGNASTATSASISTNLSGGYVIATSIYGTSVNIAGNGASADPYGTIALTQPANSSNYSYYGLTRASNLGAGFGITGTTGALGLGANAYWFGTATAGLAGTMSTAWLAFNGTSLVAVGTISGSSFTGAGTGLTGTASSLSIGGNASTATTATNVVGATNRVLFNNSTNTTTTDSNLTWNGSTFNVGGTLTATVKSFIINHPTKEGKKLQYGVLEGPEHSVYVRGRLTNENTIVLPDHWHGLVHQDTITVNLTSIGKKQDLWVEEVNAHEIKIGSENEINCFYTVFAERKDIGKLITEFDKE